MRKLTYGHIFGVYTESRLDGLITDKDVEHVLPDALSNDSPACCKAKVESSIRWRWPADAKAVRRGYNS